SANYFQGRGGLERAELAEQIVAVVLDPVLGELVALKPANDDDGPFCLAAGRGDAPPLLALGGMPCPAPHALVAGEEKIVESVGCVRKGVEEAAHRVSPGRDPAQTPVAQPVRDEILGHVFVERFEIMAVEHVLEIGAHRCVTLKSHMSSSW